MRKFYTADIGCYERGRNVELKSYSLNGAVKEAHKFLEDNKKDFLQFCDEPSVVQIYETKDKKKRIVWDEINGDLRGE